LGGWYWESGFDHDPFEKSEYIRDWNLRAAFGAWDALKNTDQVFPNHKLNWIAYVAGKRESRRLLGDIVLTKDDLLSGKRYEDGCVPTGWKIDVHIPDERYLPGFEGDAFISKALFTDYPQPFWIPYRCLYSRNIDNLFMAGRDISVTHEALGATRVMRTGGCMGEVVGIAASIARAYDTTPRNVWKEHSEEFLDLLRRPRYATVRQRIPRELVGSVGENVARAASVNVSGTYQPRYHRRFVNDGMATAGDNERRWISQAETESWITFDLPSPRAVAAMWIVSGHWSGSQLAGIMEDFVLQYNAEGNWVDVESTRTTGNTCSSIVLQFDAVESARYRLLITKAPDQLARIWEVQLFAPKSVER
jgi:hypothetical protein